MSLERWSQSAQSLVLIESLSEAQRETVTLIRLWQSDLDGKETVWTIFLDGLGSPRAKVATRALERSLSLIARNGPRKLQTRPVGNELVTSDERLLADLVDQSLSPDRETALLSAMLLVRPDLAPSLLEHMTQLSLHLRCLGRNRPFTSTQAKPRSIH